MCLTLDTRLFDGNGEECSKPMALQETNDSYRMEDPRFIGSASTERAHWYLHDESTSPGQVLAIYVNMEYASMDADAQDSAGGSQAAQFNHYAELPAELEIMALAVMGAFQKWRGNNAQAVSHESSGGGGGGVGGGGGGGGKQDPYHTCNHNADLAIQVVAAEAEAAVAVVVVVAAAKQT